MVFGSADAARQILTALAAAVITIVTLTLASTQFGPRMLRNFIRDRGTQFTLGTFVATFVYATLVLISIGPGTGSSAFVPHLSITISVGLVTLSMAVLIYRPARSGGIERFVRSRTLSYAGDVRTAPDTPDLDEDLVAG